jgi:hypothetical protein
LCLAWAALAAAVFPIQARSQEIPDLTREIQVARQALESPRVERAFAYVEGAGEETVQEWIGLCNAAGPSGNELQRSTP